MNFIIKYIDKNGEYSQYVIFGSWNDVATTFSFIKNIPIENIISIEKEPL